MNRTIPARGIVISINIFNLPNILANIIVQIITVGNIAFFNILVKDNLKNDVINKKIKNRNINISDTTIYILLSIKLLPLFFAGRILVVINMAIKDIIINIM
jgi:hypothetical protein